MSEDKVTDPVEIEEGTAEESAEGGVRGPRDVAALALASFGVGYLPIAPGTWGSIIGVGIYLAVWLLEYNLGIFLLHRGFVGERIMAWLYAANLLLFLLFCLAGIWASGRTAEVYGRKDPSEAVVDEVMGQILVFFFIPFTTVWWMILAGFLLFRLFDIWKPYPIDYLQTLPGGIGVCADDLLAAVYAGICLSVIHAASLHF